MMRIRAAEKDLELFLDQALETSRFIRADAANLLRALGTTWTGSYSARLDAPESARSNGTEARG
jgi:hypothetical protein